MSSSNGAVTPTKSKADSVGAAADGLDMGLHFKPLNLDTQNILFGTAAEGVSPTSVSRKLQASAAPFQPRTTGRPGAIAMLNMGSIPDVNSGHPTIVHSQADSIRQPSGHASGKAPGADQAPIGTRSAEASPLPRQSYGGFTTDLAHEGSGFKKTSHYIKVTGITPQDFQEKYKLLTKDFRYQAKILEQKVPKHDSSENSGKAGNTKQVKTLYLCLDDIDDCNAIEHDASLISQDWNVGFINRREWDSIKAHSTQDGDSVGRFDGQANVQAVPNGFATLSGCSPDDIPALTRDVYKLAEGFGKVYAFEQVPNSHSVNFRVEFRKWSDARNLIECVTTAQPASSTSGAWAIVASKVSEDPLPATTELPEAPSTPHRMTSAGQTQFCSPTGRSGWTENSNGDTLPVKMSHASFPTLPRKGTGPQQFFITPGSHNSRWHSEPTLATQAAMESFDYGLGYRSASHGGYPVDGRYTDSEPQQVSTKKIEDGLDVRTTIMLRNLPNRWNFQNLKTALDLTSHGKYDFSYLRIDFAYNTNVGYAFVNFTDPYDIIPFVEYWVGREWSPRAGGPRKIAQVSYATVQGYDCLVEKFRNSAIMDEYPGFRPKLWHTHDNIDDPTKVGTEKMFPPPNNMSKKQRSSDNAGSIGLFAPRSGQRGTDRSHRSHWDRGTTRQIQEDAAYYNQYGPYYGGQVLQPPIGPPPPFYASQPYGPYPGYAPPHMGYGDGFGVYGAPPAAFYGGYQYPAAPFHGLGNGYVPVNPASSLRTISNGRLAGRPRNVTVQPGNEDLFSGPSRQGNHANAVPRSFGGADGQQQFEGGESFASAVRSHVDNGQPYPQY